MDKHVSIKRNEPLSSGLNFDALRLLGIKYAQELSGDIWTDYNVHDPGVTLLEHLCYALTDLSYRAGFDIEDLLYAQEGYGQTKVNNAFFAPVDILPTTPITETDYRRLLIDRVRGIRNAWFQRIDSHSQGYQGLFRVRIQLTEGITDKQQTDEIKREVHQLLMSHRNLCEDLHEIVVLNIEHLSISAEISIKGDAFGEKVMASILHTVEQKLNPGIRYYSREELEAEGYASEDVFDGPAPLHGFIKTDDLRPLPENTHVSALREAIAKVEGVKTVDKLVVRKNGHRQDDEIIPSPNSALSLDPRMVDGDGSDGGIYLLRNGVALSINPRQTRQFHNTLSAKEKKGFQTKLDLKPPRIVSDRKRSDLSAYRSFQRLLPAVYGLGQDGLPATANRARRAQAHQLKAYLLIFEQFMADYLAQLVHVRDLFSIVPNDSPDSRHNGHALTYFSQFPEDIPEAEDLFDHGLPKNTPRKKVIEHINKELQELSAKFDPQDKRRNRFLDHMLARFGEVFTGDSLRFMESHSQEDLEEALVRGKERFLSNYPELSRDRGKAFNYREEAWETENISGLKKRVMLSLNFSGEFTDDRGKTYAKYTNRSLQPTPLMSGAALKNFPDRKSFRPQLPFHTMLREGIKEGNYDIVKKGKIFILHFRDKDEDLKLFWGADAGAIKKQEAEAEPEILFTGTKLQCEKARDQLIQRFRKINERGEGFYLLENILLRPKKNAGAILILESPFPNGGDGPILLRSLFYTNEKALSDFTSNLLIIATHKSNWAVINFGDAWRTVLLDNDQALMVTQGYPTEKDAQSARDNLLELCLDIRNNEPSRINNYLRPESERIGGSDIEPDFYSLRLSVVAPAWPAIFQDQDFRQLFQQSIAANMPAHLSVNYYWLPPQKMADFEDLFRSWLEAKRKEDEEKAQKDALDIINLLRPELVATEKEEDKKGSTNQRLPASLLRTLGETFGYSFIFRNTDFSFVQGLPATVADLLPDLGIANWTALQRASPQKLVKDIHRAKQPTSAALVKNWQKQVMLASKGRWKDLIRYQRSALKSGNLSTKSITKRAKLDGYIAVSLRDPQKAIPTLTRWLKTLPNDHIIPYPIIDFLKLNLGYGIIVPESDLRIFSCVSEAQEKALNDRSVYTWRHLSEIKDRTWKNILRELSSEEVVSDLNVLRQEAKFAMAGEWKKLIALQAPTSKNQISTTFEIRAKFKTEELMAPIKSGERALIGRLRRWEPKPTRFEFSAKSALLSVLTYDDLLSSDNFQIFEGIGEQVETALNNVGITSWRQLARRSVSRLEYELKGTISPATLKKAADWIAQADLAANGKWKELAEWQRGPIEAPSGIHEETTTLEAQIIKWIARNGQVTPNTTPP